MSTIYDEAFGNKGLAEKIVDDVRNPIVGFELAVNSMSAGMALMLMFMFGDGIVQFTDKAGIDVTDDYDELFSQLHQLCGVYAEQFLEMETSED